MATPPKNKSNRFGLFGGFKGSKSQKQKSKNVKLAEKDAKRRKKEQEKQQKAASKAAKPTKVKTGKTPTNKIPTISTSTPKLTSKDYKPHFKKKKQARKVKIIGKLEKSLPAVIEPSTVINTGNKKLDAYVKDAIDNWYEGPLDKDDIEGIEKRKEGLTVDEITSIIVKDLDIDSVTNLNLDDDPGEKPYIELEEIDQNTADFIKQNNKTVGPTGETKEAIGFIPGSGVVEEQSVVKVTPTTLFKPDGKGGYEPIMEKQEVVIQQSIGQNDRIVIADKAGNIETQANQGQEYTLPEFEAAVTKEELSKWKKDAYWNSQVQKYQDDWYNPDPSTFFIEEMKEEGGELIEDVFVGPNESSFESSISNLPSIDEIGDEKIWDKFNDSEFRAHGFKYENGKLYANIEDENIFNETPREDVILDIYDGEPLDVNGEIAKSIDIDALFLPVDLDNMDGISISTARAINEESMKKLKNFLKNNKTEYNKDYDDSENLLNIEQIFEDQQRVSSNLAAQIDQLQGDLANSNVMQDKKDIEDKVSSLKSAYTQAMLDAFTDKKISKEQMIELKEIGNTKQYNRLVPSYNAKIDVFNNIVDEYAKKPFSEFDIKKSGNKVIVTSPETGISVDLDSDLILEENNNNLSLLDIIASNENKFNDVIDKIVDYQDKLNYLQALMRDNKVITDKQFTTYIQKVHLEKKQEIDGSIADYTATLLNRIKDTIIKLPAGLVELMLQGVQAAALATSKEEFANKIAESIVNVVERSEEIMRALDVKPGDDEEFDKFNQDFQSSRTGQVQKALVELVMDIYTMKGGVYLLGSGSKLRKTKLLKLLKSSRLTRKQKIGQISKALLNINLPMMSRTSHDFKFQILNYHKKGRLKQMTPTEEIILTTGLSYAISLLDKIGIDAMASPANQALLLRLIDSVFKKGVTTREGLNNIVKKFAAKKLFNIGTNSATEVATEVTQEELERLTRKVYNSIKNIPEGKGFEVAEFLSEEWKENTADVVWVSLMTVGAYSGFNAAVDIVVKANEINELKKQSDESLKSYLTFRDPEILRMWKASLMANLRMNKDRSKGDILKANEAIKRAKQIHDILQKIPADLNIKNTKEAFDLLLNKSKLEQEISNLDPSLAAAKVEELKGTDEKLKKLALKSTVGGEFEEDAETTPKKVDPTIKEIRETSEQQEKDYPEVTVIVAKTGIEADKKAKELGSKEGMGLITSGPKIGRTEAAAKFIRNTDGKQYFIYNEQEGLITGKNKGPHEEFHKLVDDIETSTGDESSTFAMANAIINEIEKGNIDVENSEFLEILKLYESKMRSDGELADEIIANFMDAVRDGDVTIETSLKNIKSKYKKALTKFYNKLPKSLKSKLPDFGKITFETDSDFIQYLKDFGKGDRTPFEPIVDKDAETKFKTKVKPVLGVKGPEGKSDKTEDKERAAITNQDNINEKTSLINKIKELVANRGNMSIEEYNKKVGPLQKRVKILTKGIQNAEDVATIEDPNSGPGAIQRAENRIDANNKEAIVQSVVNEKMTGNTYTGTVVLPNGTELKAAVPRSEIEELLRSKEYPDIYAAYFNRDPEFKDMPIGLKLKSDLTLRWQQTVDPLVKKYAREQRDREEGPSLFDGEVETNIDDIKVKPKEIVDKKINMRRALGIIPGSDVYQNVKNAVIKTFGGKLPTVASRKLKKALQDSYATELFDDIKEMVQDMGAENFLRTYGEEMYKAIDQADMNQSYSDFTIKGPRLSVEETRKAEREGLIPKKKKGKDESKDPAAAGVFLFTKKPYDEQAWVDYHLNPTKGTKYSKLTQLYAIAAKGLGKDATMEVIQEDGIMNMYNERNKLLNQAEVIVAELAEEIQRDPKDRFALNPDKSSEMVFKAVTEAVNNGGDMSAWETAQAKLPKELRTSYKDIFERLNDLFGESQRFKQKIRESLKEYPEELQNEIDEYFKVNTQVKKKISKEGAQQLDAFNNELVNIVDPEVLNALNAPVFLGYIYGYLDGGKKDKSGKVFGPYKKQLDAIKKKIQKSKVQNNLDFNPKDIRLINSGFGLLGKAENILNKEGSVDSKFKELGLVDGKIVPGSIMDQLQKADVANKKAFSYMMVKSAEALANNPTLIPGFLRNLDTSANNTKGWRAISGVSLIQKPTEESQSIYFNNDPAQGVNTNHPYYDLAVEVTNIQFSIKATKKGGDVITAEAYEEKLAENLKFKGEHVTPVSSLNAVLAEKILDTVQKLRETSSKDEKDAILKTLGLEVDLILNTYDQVVGVKAASELIDIIGGTTSSADYARLFIEGGFDLDEYLSIIDPSSDAETVVKNKIIPEKTAIEQNTENQLEPKDRNAKVLDDSGVEEVGKQTSNPEILGKMATIDAVIIEARKPTLEIKKIRVFDFDDTVATSNSLVFYTMPDGTKGELTAEEFAKKGSEMLNKGAEFDFTDFNTVRKGKKGPLFDLLKTIKESPGDRDVFILTARAPESAAAIHTFLKLNGVDIPLENIVGLGNSSPFAKSNWMAGKIAEGYNDIYFADDAKQNVDAMKDLVEVADVKGKIQQAKERFALNGEQIAQKLFDLTAAKNKEGLSSEALKNISEAKAELKGSKIKDERLMAASAQNFTGLLYRFLGKGEQGNADYEFLKENLVEPYTRALNEVNNFQNSLIADHKQLMKTFVGKDKPIKNLQSQVPGLGGYTYQDMIRALAWDKQGITIDGLPKSTLDKMKNIASKNESINTLAQQLVDINKGDGYYYPGDTWRAGTIMKDLLQGVTKVKRPKAMSEWLENIETVFGEYSNGKYRGQLMNAIEATYGSKYREALEDMLRRMTSGINRKQTSSRLENQFYNWLNNSVGAVMFFNMRSGLLQTLSAANYINWSFNNPAKAAAAFANQKQYWSDFMFLMNSDFLVDRRTGLKINVSESEIFNEASGATDKASAVLNTFLRAGFSITQIADSFAIASGGATFYRNRVTDLVMSGSTKADAEKQAYDEWTALSREAQQSSDALEVSSQQAGGLGRVLLAFANTPMQYNRIIYKAVSDIKNGRGDFKSNLSRIAYYGALQNLMFNSLQQAVFAAFGSEDEEEIDDKTIGVLNGMLDSLLKGMGVSGTIVSALKDIGVDIYDRSQKPRPEYVKVVSKAFNIAPPIDVKMSKAARAANTYEYNRKNPMNKDYLNPNNPLFMSTALIVAASTNIPLDRLLQKTINVNDAMQEDQENWKRIMLVLGWSEWQLNSKQENDEKKQMQKEYYESIKENRVYNYKPIESLPESKEINTTVKKIETKEEEKIIKTKFKKVSFTDNKSFKNHRIPIDKRNENEKILYELSTPEQKDSLKSLGLTDEEIKSLKYEGDRVQKIQELLLDRIKQKIK